MTAPQPAAAKSVLTPLALQNEDVLRALAANTGRPAADKMWTSVKQLAEYLGRDDSNLGKSLRALHEAGLIYQPAGWHGLTAAGATVVAALDRAAGGGGDMSATGMLQLTHGQIEPDPLNPRKHFDAEALAELADSIAKDDLLENLVVRDFPILQAAQARPASEFAPTHRLVAGERRWRAIGLLIQDGRWAQDRPIACKLVAIDDAAHRRIALVENLQRNDLRPIDEANGLKELMELEKVGTAEIAKELSRTQRFVQQRLQLLDLPPELQVKLNAGELSVERGREAAAMWPKLPPIKQVELREGKITVEACRKWLADQPEPVEIDDDQLLILAEVAWAIAAKPANVYSTTICDYRVAGLPIQMETADLLHFGRGYYGPDEGKTNVRLSAKAFGQIRRLCGADGTLNRTALEPLLRRARFQVIGGNPLASDYRPDAHKDVDRLFKEKRFHTAWLNKPFDLDPDIKAKKEREKAAEVQRNAEWKERERAEVERREAAAAAASKARESATRFCAAAAERPPAAQLEGLTAQFQDVGNPLPWRTDEKGAVLDAVGGVVIQGHWTKAADRDVARRQLLCAAVNTAAGVAFAAPDAPPPPLTREAYVQRVAAQLLEVEAEDGIGAFADMAIATEAAGKALDALLARNELDFGDPDQDWDAIVDDLVNDAFDAAQTPAEEAA